MSISKYFRRLKTDSLVALFSAIAFSLGSCEKSFIYEYEGDCEPAYKIEFIYDRNLKFADAFSAEVKEITVFVIDSESGETVWARHDDSDNVGEPGYSVEVDVPPGNYTILAWCGEGVGRDFALNETRGERKTDLQCRLTARSAPPQFTPGPNGEMPGYEGVGEGDHVSNKLGHLYHGVLSEVDFPEGEGVHTFTLPLTKNTNDVHIVLQHLNGEPVDPSQFIFSIEDSNGHMDWDNSLIPSRALAYHSWAKNSASAGIDNPGVPKITRAQTQVSAAVADLRTGRLVKGQNAIVKITRTDGTPVVKIPFIDYCLLVKGQHRDLDDQDYLDRQDDYTMVFFLDSQDRWMDQYIYINSWKVVLQNSEL